MNKAPWKVNFGPIIVSALSFIVTFFLLQTLTRNFCPEINLLANKGIGKFTFMGIVIIHLILFCTLMPSSFFRSFIQTNVSFFKTTRWIKDFFIFFGLFAALHALFLLIEVATGYAVYNYHLDCATIKLACSLIIGFIVTFLLAWSEEMIFRGTLYPYLALDLSPLLSITITSLIFMLVHNITAPWRLVTTDYKLGLGLFLLGFLLNMIFVITKKLYCSMGAHAGLVFIKVCLRRAPIITILPHLPWWLHTDLRQSFLVHGVFALSCIILYTSHKNSFAHYRIERKSH